MMCLNAVSSLVSRVRLENLVNSLEPAKEPVLCHQSRLSLPSQNDSSAQRDPLRARKIPFTDSLDPEFCVSCAPFESCARGNGKRLFDVRFWRPLSRFSDREPSQKATDLSSILVLTGPSLQDPDFSGRHNCCVFFPMLFDYKCVGVLFQQSD